MPVTTVTPRQIEVLIAVDAHSLNADIPGSLDPNQPTMLTHQQADQYIVMMAPRPFMLAKAVPDSNLQLKAVTDDVIRWRCAPYGPLRSGALLVAFNPAGGNQNVLSRPDLVPVEKWTLVQRVEGQPRNLSREHITDPRWEATCRTAGSVNYNFTIATIDPGDEKDTKVTGYYKWDPNVTVTFS